MLSSFTSRFFTHPKLHRGRGKEPLKQRCVAVKSVKLAKKTTVFFRPGNAPSHLQKDKTQGPQAQSMPGTRSPPYGPLPPARCAEGLAGYRRPRLSPALEEREQGQSAVLQRIPGMGPPSWALRGGKSTLRQSALLFVGGLI